MILCSISWWKEPSRSPNGGGFYHLVFECTLGADNHVGVVVVGHALVEVVVAVGRLVVVGGLRFDDRPPRLSAHLADVDARSVAEGASVAAPMARR